MILIIMNPIYLYKESMECYNILSSEADFCSGVLIFRTTTYELPPTKLNLFKFNYAPRSYIIHRHILRQINLCF